MAGHPTIATTWALVESRRVTLTGVTTKITLELQIGPLEVEIWYGAPSFTALLTVS